MPAELIATTKKSPRRRPVRQITADYVAALEAYSQMLFKGGFAPASVKRHEGVAALIEVGRDIGLPATQAVANVMIVNGRPSMWGDAVMGLILASGLLEDRAEWYEGTEGEDDYTACFSVKRVGSAKPRVTRFSIADAKRANLWEKKGPWTEYPYRQMMWRAKAWGCRDEFPDVLCGLAFMEEALDIPEASGRVTVEQPEPAAIEAKPAKGADVKGAAQPVVPELEPLNTILDRQLDRLAELKSLMCATKGATSDEDRRAAWLEHLKPYGVESALDLTATKAEDLIDELAAKYDLPFHPLPAPSTPAT